MEQDTLQFSGVSLSSVFVSIYNELVQNVTEAGESHSSQPDGINTTVPTVPRKRPLYSLHLQLLMWSLMTTLHQQRDISTSKVELMKRSRESGKVISVVVTFVSTVYLPPFNCLSVCNR